MGGQTTLFLTATGALVLGILVYLLDRPAQDVYFLADTLVLTSRPAWDLHDSLPSVLHAFAFSLATIVVIAPASIAAIGRICAGWWLLEALLEIVQADSLSAPLTELMPAWLGSVPVLEALPSYVAQGTFDLMDVGGAGLGCLLAFGAAYLQRRPAWHQAVSHTN